MTHDCSKCLRQLDKDPRWQESERWHRALEVVPSNQKLEWLQNNPMPDYPLEEMIGHARQATDFSTYYVCGRGHMWKYGKNRGLGGTEVIFLKKAP